MMMRLVVEEVTMSGDAGNAMPKLSRVCKWIRRPYSAE
jgi:hypothetical protein